MHGADGSVFVAILPSWNATASWWFQASNYCGQVFQREVWNLLLLRKPLPFSQQEQNISKLWMCICTHICTCMHFPSAAYFPSVISQMTFSKYPYEMPGNPNGDRSSQPFSTTACKSKSSWKFTKAKWPWETHWDTWEKSKPTHCKELQTKTGLKTSTPPVTTCHIIHC